MNETCPHQSHQYHFGRGGKDAEHQAHQADIQTLLSQHNQLERRIELLSNGFSAITTSDNPALVRVLQRHVYDMKARFAKGRAIRSWDAVYALLFAYRDQIQVEVLHTHAQAVSLFVQQGKQAAGESYPLSEKALEKLANAPHN